MIALSLIRAAYGEFGSVVCHPMRHPASPAANVAVGTRPEAASVEDPAPASGHLFRTPPSAVDDPAGVSSPLTPAGSPLDDQQAKRVVDWLRAMIRHDRSDHDIVRGFARLLEVAGNGADGA